MTGILALDLARRTGWAVAPPEYNSSPFAMADTSFQLIRYGAVRLGEDHCPAGELYSALHRWIGRTLHQELPAVVAMEAAFIPQFKFKGADVPFGLAAIVEMQCHNLNIPLYRYQPKSIKKHWADDGNAKKSDMIRAAQERGLNPSDDNVADACALLDFAVASLASKGHWPPRSSHEQRHTVGTARAS